MNQLKRLDLEQCGLTELSGLNNLLTKALNLEALILCGNKRIQSETLLLYSEMKDLRHMDLSDCGLTNLSVLTNVLTKTPNLEELILKLNRVESRDLRFVLELNQLKRLDLRHCGFTDLSGLIVGDSLEILI
jgi:Leucine-rich repeat (LRR) protein